MNRIRSRKAKGFSETLRHIASVIIFIALVAALLAKGLPAYAMEGAGTHYVGGNEDFMAGALPPPGIYPIHYGVYFTSDRWNDNSGNDMKLDLKANIYAYAFRFVHVTNMKLFGADWAWQVIVPLVDKSVKIGVAGIDKRSRGVGDIEFSPLVLGWHFNKNMHLIGAVDFSAPTGSYDKNDPSSVGNNYWTIAPILAPTYISDGGFEVSAKVQYFFNTKNNDTKYTSGNEVLIDYLVGQHVGNWNFGINGFI